MREFHIIHLSSLASPLRLSGTCSYWGVDLTLPIASETIANKKVFFVDGDALAACFDPQISEALVKELALRKPLRAVFRDSGFGDDSMKINIEQIFKLLSPNTKLKSL